MAKRAANKVHETLIEAVCRFRDATLMILIPIVVISIILFVVPRSPSNSSDYFLSHRKAVPLNRRGHSSSSSSSSSHKRYVVIFDAGSSGSRVHVFCFNEKLNLIPMGKDIEVFLQIKPGLSAYAAEPEKAADSLMSLVASAEKAIPEELVSGTPVRVGATAGLRSLEGDASDRILQSVRDLLKYKSSLMSKPEWVTVIDGTQEGSFQWVTINYLLGNLGKEYSSTVGVVDLGGGSVQMAYAISAADVAGAPEGSYVKKMKLKGTQYDLYVHSYLRYGLLAGRAEILKASGTAANPCILKGYTGSYKYGGGEFRASSPGSGASVEKCRTVTMRALDKNSTCAHMKCTFGGVWNGGGGDGQRNLFIASFFFDRASEVGLVDAKANVAKVRAMDFGEAAKRACKATLDEAGRLYPRIEPHNLPYICMDLVYQFALLVDGFGLDPWQSITLVKKVEYRGFPVEAAWPLGSAIEAVST